VRGDVQNAPIEKQYPGSNAYQTYAARATLLWKPTENLSVTPSYFHTTSTQNGISAYDSDPGHLAHYQPFDIAEPLTDSLTAYSLNVNYSFRRSI
jgi:iron complex outermembrane receptor protein